jgi:hypothetical protein
MISDQTLAMENKGFNGFGPNFIFLSKSLEKKKINFFFFEVEL